MGHEEIHENIPLKLYELKNLLSGRRPCRRIWLAIYRWVFVFAQGFLFERVFGHVKFVNISTLSR